MEIRTAELGELQLLMKNELRHLYPERELRGIITVLFSHLTGLTPAQLVLQKDRKLSESEILFLQRALKRLLQHEPVQYITGKSFFHGYEFAVNKNVLIPRPETEELVDWIVKDHGRKDNLVVLDIGTGSGCIAVTLDLKLPHAELTALDASAEALQLASFNATSLGARVRFELIDILHKDEREDLGIFDIIVSNPPYVTRDDRQKMLPNVTEFEPAFALFVEEDHLLFYREIIDFTKTHLQDGGHIYFEGNESYADQVAELLEAAGFHEIEVRKDMQGKKRMLKGKMIDK